MSKKLLTKKQKEELQKLTDDILGEAKKVKDDYKDNPSEWPSGSGIFISGDSDVLKNKYIRFEQEDDGEV